MNVLVINCGSSSLKYQLIDSETEEVLAKGPAADKDLTPCSCLLIEPIPHTPDGLDIKRLFWIWLNLLP